MNVILETYCHPHSKSTKPRNVSGSAHISNNGTPLFDFTFKSFSGKKSSTIDAVFAQKTGEKPLDMLSRL